MVTTRRYAFTLIELLVVIAIIAVLAAILFPVFARAREKARQSTCLSNQRQIAAAILMYLQDHDESFPNTGTVWSDINVEGAILVCPTLGKSVANGYAFNANYGGVALGTITDPVAAVMTADSLRLGNIMYMQPDADLRHSSKAVFTCVDGHVDINAIVPLWFLPTQDMFAGLKTTVQSGGSAMVYNDTTVATCMAYDAFTPGQNWDEVGTSSAVHNQNGGSRADGLGAIPYGGPNATQTTAYGGQFDCAKYTSFNGNPAPCIVWSQAHDWGNINASRQVYGCTTKGWAVSGDLKAMNYTVSGASLVGATSAPISTSAVPSLSTAWNSFVINCSNGKCLMKLGNSTYSVQTFSINPITSIVLGGQGYNGAGANSWVPSATYKGMWLSFNDSSNNPVAQFRMDCATITTESVLLDNLKWDPIK